MSVIKTVSAALTATAVVISVAGVANAMVGKKSHTNSTVQSSLPDNNASTSLLSGKAFFDRLANQGQ